MRHRKKGRKLKRHKSHRKALLRNLVTSLIEHGAITTTDAKAKELRKVAEKLITLGKKALRSSFPEDMPEDVYRAKRVHYLRQILAVVTTKDAAFKVLNDYAELFKERPGGYTRIIKVGNRRGDNAPISIIEFVERPE